MSKLFLGVQLEPLKKGQRDIAISLPKETIEYLDSLKPKKTKTDYLIDFLGSEEKLKKAMEVINEAIEKAMPKDLEKNCPKCGPNAEKIDEETLGYQIIGVCDRYRTQMHLTFEIASIEFVQIMVNNKFVHKDKETQFELAKKFFSSFCYKEGGGVLAFDLDGFCRYFLSKGFLSISQFFTNSDVLKNLTIINNTIDKLEEENIQNKLFKREDENYLEIQKDFFLSKQRFYKEEIRLQRARKLQDAELKNSRGSAHERPYSTDIAFFCYYTSESKELITENPFGSKKAWREIANIYKKDDTNIQKAYNRIFCNKVERLKQSKIANINYVIDNMLDDYPKAKKLALEELKSAKMN